MLKNKSIVIIGGTSGIGFAAAKEFQKNGANLVLVGKPSTELESDISGNVEILFKDASDEFTAQKAVKLCVEKFGKLDGLFHVAGGSGRAFGDGALDQMTKLAWEKTLDLNLTSVMLSNKAAVNMFLSQNTSGTILNLGSVLADFPSPELFVTHAYAAAKSAIDGFTKSIAAYYAKNNIRVNALKPGLIQTPMSIRAMENKQIMDFIKSKQPLDSGRIGTPEDLIGAATFFMSDASKFITGQILSVDGGWSISEGQHG